VRNEGLAWEAWNERQEIDERSCMGYLSVAWYRADAIPSTITATYGKTDMTPSSRRDLTAAIPRRPRYASSRQLCSLTFAMIIITVK
jgi:hypothetical protein